MVRFTIFSRFQPIELVKPFFIIMISIILSLKNKNNLYLKYLFTLGIVLPIILLLISQPDIGQTLLIILTEVNLGICIRYKLDIFLFFFYYNFFNTHLFNSFFYLSLNILEEDLLHFLDPNSGNNYQSEKASEAISNGGFLVWA